MSVSALVALIVASPIDDLALLWLAGKFAPRASFSNFVAGGIGSPANSGDSIMAAKNTTASANDAAELDRIVAAITASRGTKSSLSLSSFLSDKAADSMNGIARIGAGFAAGAENASFAFAAERERQTRRTAASILAAARAA